MSLKNKAIDFFSTTLNLDKTTSSYKFWWLLSLLEEIRYGNKIIPIKRCCFNMIKFCWYAIKHNKISFGSEKIDCLKAIISSSKESKFIDFAKNISDIKRENIIKQLSRYVPYLFLSPFTNINKNRADYVIAWCRKNNVSSNDDIPYYFSNNKIIINELWFDVLYKYNSFFVGWALYKFTIFLNSRSENKNIDISKLFEIHQRRSLSQFVKLFKPKKGIHIDHFIPWSYCHDDRIYNLWKMNDIDNIKKSNKLPNNMLIKEFIKQQKEIFNDIKKYKKYKKYKGYIDEYKSIGITSNDNFNERLQEYINNTIKSASLYGFVTMN